MSRPIKFRAWNFKTKQMFSSEEMTADQLALLPNGHFANISSLNTRLSVIYPVTTMLPLQYTGIKDKNNVEIYEGDLLKYKDVIYECEWSTLYAGWMYTERKGYNPKADPDEVEVIGNIYENPELLESAA